MATNRWVSKAAKVAQVNTVTPGSVGIGNTFTLTINGKSVTYTATAATAANVSAGAVPLWNGADEGEMDEATATDGSGTVVITADEPGVPFTQTSSASGGTATFSTSTTTSNSSPNDINNATNWTDGVPTASDDVVLDAGGEDQGLWWNLGALSAVTVGTFVRRRGFTGRIALPEYNTDGANTFFEYRATELAIGATTMLIEQPGSDGPEHVKVNVGSVQTALTILGDGAAAIGEERMWWRGTHADNVVRVSSGSLAISPTNLNASTVATLTAESSTVRCGSAVTLTTVTVTDSECEFNSSITTLSVNGDSNVVLKAGTTTTLNANAGRVIFRHSSGTIVTTLNVGPGAVLDFSQGTGGVTITNAVTFPAGCQFLDPEGRVTFTNGFALGKGVKWEDVTLDLGPGRTFTVS